MSADTNNSLIADEIHMNYFKTDAVMCHTKSQHTQAHDNLLAGHHPCDDAAQHSVVADECDEGLREFSIAADVHRNTAAKQWDRLTANMKR